MSMTPEEEDAPGCKHDLSLIAREPDSPPSFRCDRCGENFVVQPVTDAAQYSAANRAKPESAQDVFDGVVRYQLFGAPVQPEPRPEQQMQALGRVYLRLWALMASMRRGVDVRSVLVLKKISVDFKLRSHALENIFEELYCPDLGDEVCMKFRLGVVDGIIGRVLLTRPSTLEAFVHWPSGIEHWVRVDKLWLVHRALEAPPKEPRSVQ